MSAHQEILTRPNSTHAPKSSMDTEMTSPLTSLEERPRTRSSSPATEKMSSFHSARERSERLISRPANGGYNNTSPNQKGSWREEVPAMNSPPNYQYSQQQYNPNAPMMGGYFPAPPRPRGNSIMMGENSVPMSSVVPGGVWPTEAQMTASYGYGYRREDGSITRLIPADELPSLANVQPRQGPEGLIIVPTPRQTSPNDYGGLEIMIPRAIVQQLSAVRPYSHNHEHGNGNSYDPTQMQIDSIVAHASPTDSVSPPSQRREKIYCDKWIHEGVCAFTQMGCKYKHEMPMDKVTQMGLGLNHGLPNWYRRAYAINLHEPSAPVAIASPPRARTEGSWRNRARSQLEAAPTSAGGSQSVPVNNRYGPIAPPANSHLSPSHNPYSTLKLEEREAGEVEDDEEDTVTWQGRHH